MSSTINLNIKDIASGIVGSALIGSAVSYGMGSALGALGGAVFGGFGIAGTLGAYVVIKLCSKNLPPGLKAIIELASVFILAYAGLLSGVNACSLLGFNVTFIPTFGMAVKGVVTGFGALFAGSALLFAAFAMTAMAIASLVYLYLKVSKALKPAG